MNPIEFEGFKSQFDFSAIVNDQIHSDWVKTLNTRNKLASTVANLNVAVTKLVNTPLAQLDLYSDFADVVPDDYSAIAYLMYRTLVECSGLEFVAQSGLVVSFHDTDGPLLDPSYFTLDHLVDGPKVSDLVTVTTAEGVEVRLWGNSIIGYAASYTHRISLYTKAQMEYFTPVGTSIDHPDFDGIAVPASSLLPDLSAGCAYNDSWSIVLNDALSGASIQVGTIIEHVKTVEGLTSEDRQDIIDAINLASDSGHVLCSSINSVFKSFCREAQTALDSRENQQGLGLDASQPVSRQSLLSTALNIASTIISSIASAISTALGAVINVLSSVLSTFTSKIDVETNVEIEPNASTNYVNGPIAYATDDTITYAIEDDSKCVVRVLGPIDAYRIHSDGKTYYNAFISNNIDPYTYAAALASEIELHITSEYAINLKSLADVGGIDAINARILSQASSHPSYYLPSSGGRCDWAYLNRGLIMTPEYRNSLSNPELAAKHVWACWLCLGLIAWVGSFDESDRFKYYKPSDSSWLNTSTSPVSLVNFSGTVSAAQAKSICQSLNFAYGCWTKGVDTIQNSMPSTDIVDALQSIYVDCIYKSPRSQDQEGQSFGSVTFDCNPYSLSDSNLVGSRTTYPAVSPEFYFSHGALQTELPFIPTDRFMNIPSVSSRQLRLVALGMAAITVVASAAAFATKKYMAKRKFAKKVATESRLSKLKSAASSGDPKAVNAYRKAVSKQNLKASIFGGRKWDAQTGFAGSPSSGSVVNKLLDTSAQTETSSSESSYDQYTSIVDLIRGPHT